jgi:NAD-dependent dihydropyrimidine dehydrogenase PreA subunit
VCRPWIIVSAYQAPDALNAVERALIDQCRQRGLNCLVMPHLYHVADASTLWKELSERIGHAVLLCWLHPRAAEWLLPRRGIPSQGLTILNLAAFPTADAAMAAILGALEVRGQAATAAQPRPTGQDALPGAAVALGASTRPRWYPVVDGSRCTGCGHCVQFCLFGVYELDAQGGVEVRNPDQCKPGCPACARICPQSAIMFPLYEQDAAIAGAAGEEVSPDAAARATAPLPFDDLDELVDRLERAMQRRH